MTNAHPASQRQPDLSQTSRSDQSSNSSSQEPTIAPQYDGRSSFELQTLLRSSSGDGRSASPPFDEHVSAEQSEEEERYIRPISRVTSMSKSYTTEEEQVIIRKLDRRLVLFMALLYMLSFLDRSNIGNARIAGLESSLSLQPGQYAWLLTAFYITYISFEWMTFLYRIVPPHIYISLCVLSWGLVASLQSVSTSFTSLVIFRALLGIAEAAFGPGVPFYLSFFYKRSELAYRVGLFISAAPLATSCASSLAWLIVKMSQHGPLEPWRALFLIEGFPSIIVAFFAWHIIPDSPSTAKYLTPRERKVAKLRLHSEEQPATTLTNLNPKPHLSLTDLLSTLSTPLPYLTSLMFFSANISFSSLPVFLPTILQSMSLPSLTSQLLSAPPYLLSFLFVLYTSRLSDSIPNSRGILIMSVSLLSSVSYLAIALAGYHHDVLGTTTTLIVRYVSVFGAAMGFFSAITLIITWTLNNQHTDTGKGAGVAMMNLVGQCGPLVGTRLYPQDQAPYFVKGMLVCAGFMAGVAGLAAGLRWWLGVLNGREEREREGGGVEMVELGEGEEGEGNEEEEGPGQGLMGRGRRRRISAKRRFEYML